MSPFELLLILGGVGAAGIGVLFLMQRAFTQFIPPLLLGGVGSLVLGLVLWSM